MFSGMTFYDEVLRKRATIPRGTAYTIGYRGADVECKNLTFDPTLPITEGDKKVSSRCAWLPPMAPKAAAASAKRKRAASAAEDAQAAVKWQPGTYDPSKLTVADKLEVYVEVTEKDKGDYCHWMSAAIEAARVVSDKGKKHEFLLEYADTTKAWTRLAAKDFAKGRKNAPGWRLDPDFYTKDADGKIELKREQAPARKGEPTQKHERGGPHKHGRTRGKRGPPASSSSSDDGNMYESDDGISPDSSDSGTEPTGNPDIDNLTKGQRSSLRLDKNGDTDSGDEPGSPGVSDFESDTSDQPGGSTHGFAPALAEREAGIRKMAGLMALNCDTWLLLCSQRQLRSAGGASSCKSQKVPNTRGVMARVSTLLPALGSCGLSAFVTICARNTARLSAGCGVAADAHSVTSACHTVALMTGWK